MASRVVKVRREIVEACMTCPLCNKLLKEATTISLCLHTFCRKCIYEKLSDEEVDCCPVCNVDLGCLPVDKLRPDHNLQDIRAKIFPLKRRKINAPEVLVSPSIASPVKRKERSLSSLVVSTPKVTAQTGLTGRRSRAVARKAAALRGCTYGIDQPLKKEEEEDSGKDCRMSSSSPESLNKIPRYRRQDSSGTHHPSSNDPRLNKNKGTVNNNFELTEGKTDLWTPLNCLVEAANRTKSSKSNSQGPSHEKQEQSTALDGNLDTPETKQKTESAGFPDSRLYMPKTKNKEHRNVLKMKDGNNNNKRTLGIGPVKRRRMRTASGNKGAGPLELCPTAQAMLDTSAVKGSRRNNPIWFSLVASEDRRGDVSLPQISAPYLRIRDGKMPVSFIQKYLVKKLDLLNEAEVEIMCRGQRVLPTLQLQNIIDLWFRTGSTAKKVPASVGSSAKEFVMVLSYCRKVQTP